MGEGFTRRDILKAAVGGAALAAGIEAVEHIEKLSNDEIMKRLAKENEELEILRNKYIEVAQSGNVDEEKKLASEIQKQVRKMNELTSRLDPNNQ